MSVSSKPPEMTSRWDLSQFRVLALIIMICLVVYNLCVYRRGLESELTSQRPLGKYVFAGHGNDGLDAYREDAKRWIPDVEKLSADNASAGSPHAIVCLGSSSFRMWDSIEKDMAPYRMVRRAYGGAKFSDLAIHIPQLIRDVQFQAAFVFVGNDITGKPDDKSPQEVARLATKVVESIHEERPQAAVYLIAVTPTPKRFDAWPNIREANLELESLAKRSERAFFIPTESAFLHDDVPRSELFQEDQLHLNHTGYLLWASILKRALDTHQTAPE